MRRIAASILIVLILVATLMTLASPKRVSARVAIPHVQDCTNGCASIDAFDGNQHGIQSFVIVSNPTINSASAKWERYLSEDNGGTEWLGAGLIKKGSGFRDQLCNNTGSGLFYFALYIDPAGNQFNVCQLVPGGDYNFGAQIEIGYFTSNGGGMFVKICGVTGTNSLCTKPQYYNGASQTWYYGQYSEFTSNYWNPPGSWKNVLVSGWVKNQYQSVSDGAWDYQQTGGDVLARNPPQMYWYIYPAGASNQGGQLWSCDYDDSVAHGSCAG